MVSRASSYKFPQGGNVRLLFLVWLVIEALQLVLIGMLIVGYRNLQRRMDEGRYRFDTHPPPSVTNDVE